MNKIKKLPLYIPNYIPSIFCSSNYISPPLRRRMLGVLEECFKVRNPSFKFLHSDVSIKVLTEGHSNKTYRVTISPETTRMKRVLLFKIYNDKKNVLINRKKAHFIRNYIYEAGIGNKVICYFRNGSIEKFIEGRTLSLEEVRNPKFQKLIAEKLRTLHDTTSNIDEKYVKNNLWTVIERWVSKIKNTKEYTQCDERKKELLRKLEKCLEANKKIFGSCKKEDISLCHNDLLGGNILYHRKKKTLNFIDFEFSDFYPKAFDLVNHFNEYRGIECHQELYPTKEIRLNFIKYYLGEHEREKTPMLIEECNALLEETESYKKVSDLYWSFWALCRSIIKEEKIEHGNNSDFNYFQYSLQRYELMISDK